MNIQIWKWAMHTFQKHVVNKKRTSLEDILVINQMKNWKDDMEQLYEWIVNINH